MSYKSGVGGAPLFCVTGVAPLQSGAAVMQSGLAPLQVALQRCKATSHHCIVICSNVKRPRTIARPFYSTVSSPSNGARRFYIVTLRARRFSLYRRRTVSRRVRVAGRAWRSGGSIRGLASIKRESLWGSLWLTNAD